MFLRFFSIFISVSTLVSCSNSTKSNFEAAGKVGGGEVNLYSQRHYDVDRLVYDKFEKETGIKVNVISAGADELLAKLQSEEELTSCDLFLAVDAGNLYKAKQSGLLQSIKSPVLEKNIAPQFRDAQGYWYGQTMRARVIAVRKGLKEKYPNLDYKDLVLPQFKGKVLMRSSSSSYNQALLAAMIGHYGEAEAKSWAVGVKANFAREPRGNDRDQIKDIAAGLGEITLINTYYLGKMQKSDDPAEQKALEAVEVIFPGQTSLGTHINVSGAGVAKYAKNKENAIRLLEFLAREDIQREFALNNEEYPVGGKFVSQGILSQLGAFKTDSLNLELLGKFNSVAVTIFDQVGWK